MSQHDAVGSGHSSHERGGCATGPGRRADFATSSHRGRASFSRSAAFALAILLATGVSRAGDAPQLPAPPGGVEPAARGRAIAAIIEGRVVETAPDPAGRPCPVSVVAEGSSAPVPLPWNADLPPWNTWKTGDAAVCGLDSLGRLVAAAPPDARGAIAAARVPSSRFSDREIAWILEAVARLPNSAALGEARRKQSGEERARWAEIAIRGRTDRSSESGIPWEALPSDLVRLGATAGVGWIPANSELLRRGESPVVERRAVPDRFPGTTRASWLLRDRTAPILLAASDPEIRAAAIELLSGSDGVRRGDADTALRVLAEAGYRDDPGMRAAIRPHIGRGTVPALCAWIERGGSAKELLEFQPGAPLVLDQHRAGGAGGAPAAEWMNLAVARTAQSPEDGLLWASRIAKTLPDAACAGVLAAFDGVAPFADPGTEMHRLAIRARLGDGAAASRLAAFDWTTIERGEDRRSIAFLELLTGSRGMDAARALVRFLLQPEPPRGGAMCGNRNDADARRIALDSLSGRPSEDRAACLAAIDGLGPPSAAFGDFALGLRWRLGAPPAAADLRKALNHGHRLDAPDLPRGAWGPDEAALRALLVEWRDWRSLLALDGRIPAPLAEAALTALRTAGNPPRRTDGLARPITPGEALEIVVVARPEGALEAVRALLGGAAESASAGHGRDRRDSPEVWDAIGRLTPRAALGELALEMVKRTDVHEPGRRTASWAAYGLLTALAVAPR